MGEILNQRVTGETFTIDESENDPFLAMIANHIDKEMILDIVKRGWIPPGNLWHLLTCPLSTARDKYIAVFYVKSIKETVIGWWLVDRNITDRYYSLDGLTEYEEKDVVGNITVLHIVGMKSVKKTQK